MKEMKLLLFLFIFFSHVSFGQKIEKSKNEDETSLKNYFDSNTIDPLEGIYKTVAGTFYRFGIKKYGDEYIAIILEAENNRRWKTGDVKAYFEKSSVDNIYAVKWLMSDKYPKETIGMLENESVLKIRITAYLSNSSEETVFLKIYPANRSETKKDNILKVTSGSGFFVSTSGLVATNAHVVDNAKNIEVSISSDIGSLTYKAKLVLKDSRNDVALIQIDDTLYKEFVSLPYGLSDKADIGEKSFTIGYPLNNIMGTNYKVTDGLINAKSGVGDDVRYYQVSIPLQPGNSGGPLFNSEGNVIGITSARLNSDAVGTSVENVNYAVKATYLISLMSMIPNSSIPQPTSQLSKKDLKDQVKILKDYVCLIRVIQ